MYRICMYVCGYNKSEYIGFIFASAKNVFLLLCSEQLLSLLHLWFIAEIIVTTKKYVFI